MMAPGLILFAYLLGTIPFSFLVGRLHGLDLRSVGSGNLGATNVYRTLGGAMALVVFVGDALKGAVAVLLAQFLLFPYSPWVAMGCALAAILGHTLSFWVGFRGGKGVATSFGALVVLMPLPSLASFALFWVIFFSTRYVSAGSIVSAMAFPLFVLLFRASIPPEIFPYYLGGGGIMAGFVVYKHRDNIRRLRNGTENRIQFSGEAARASTGGNCGG